MIMWLGQHNHTTFLQIARSWSFKLLPYTLIGMSNCHPQCSM